MEKENQRPLTFNQMVEYNQKTLLPAIGEIVVSKNDFNVFKKDFGKFKNETLANIDDLLKKIDILLENKDVEKYQKGKERKFFAIMIKALKEHNILSIEDLEEISKLEIF